MVTLGTAVLERQQDDPLAVKRDDRDPQMRFELFPRPE
jgi:hypothetical protein